jgi:hypothetical protein
VILRFTVAIIITTMFIIIIITIPLCPQVQLLATGFVPSAGCHPRIIEALNLTTAAFAEKTILAEGPPAGRRVRGPIYPNIHR